MTSQPSYPPSAPAMPSSSSSTPTPSWLPGPLASLAAALSFAYRNLNPLAVGLLYARDPLVHAALLAIPL